MALAAEPARSAGGGTTGCQQANGSARLSFCAVEGQRGGATGTASFLATVVLMWGYQSHLSSKGQRLEQVAPTKSIRRLAEWFSPRRPDEVNRDFPESEHSYPERWSSIKHTVLLSARSVTHSLLGDASTNHRRAFVDSFIRWGRGRATCVRRPQATWGQHHGGISGSA